MSKSHGMTNSKEYSVYTCMMTRCYNKKREVYKYYGGKGITVVQRWHSFENFIEDMGPIPSPNYTIERLDVNKAYGPDNCIWETWHIQRRSRTDNYYLTLGEASYVETDWCYALGFKKGGSIKRRVKRGWALERALTTNSSGTYVDPEVTIEILKKNLEDKIYFCRKSKQFKRML